MMTQETIFGNKLNGTSSGYIETDYQLSRLINLGGIHKFLPSQPIPLIDEDVFSSESSTIIISNVFSGAETRIYIVYYNSTYCAFETGDGYFCQLKAILDFLKALPLIPKALTICTTSGVVSGILAKTRPCPASYKPLVREIFRFLGACNLQLRLDVNNQAVKIASLSDISNTSNTLNLLSQAYLVDNSLEKETTQLNPSYHEVVLPDFASAL